MEQIPFKQTESVSNNNILLLVFVLLVIAVLLYYALKYLKQKGIVSTINTSKESAIKLTEVKRLSKDSLIFLIEIDGKKHTVVESNKHVSLTTYSTGEEMEVVKLKEIDED